MKLINCNFCGAVFRLDQIKIEKRTIKGSRSIVQSFFKCPECGEEYTVTMTDPETRELIRAGKRDEARERSLMLQRNNKNYNRIEK